jgi:hypothetical protein
MQLDAKNVKDAKPYLEYYWNKGLATNLLERCNAQSFKTIDGAGEGYFITTDTRYTTGQSVTLTLPSIGLNVVIVVLDTVEIEHPDATGKTIILHTAEQKYTLKQYTVRRNYNVINRRTQIDNTFDMVPPDTTAKTLLEILNDFLVDGPEIGASYTGPTIYPYDVFIQGMTHLEAIDYLCSAYGLLWTYNSGSVYVYSVTTPLALDFNKVSDIQNYVLPVPVRSLVVGFPILDCCQQYPNTQHDILWSVADEGEALEVYMPFYQAIYSDGGSVTNSSALTIFTTNLRAQIQAIEKMAQTYLVKERYEFVNLTALPASLCVTYGDYGVGPRTIYSGKHYPYLKSPFKVKTPQDRQAKNWVGYLYQEYAGVVPGFWATPAFGIDGLAPATNQYIVNLYKWNYGAAGAAIRVEWDCVNYRWIPLQQEYICPPNGAGGTPDGPPGAPSYTEPVGGI